MKLIVQIPCFNEENSLADAVRDIPRNIEGIDKVEVLIVDDGSSDETIAVAKACGVDHIIRHTRNKGLARTFSTALQESLALGADIIVNTDGDNQYAGADIPKLVAPVVAGEADIVVGDRRGVNNPHFSAFKKRLQVLGSWGISKVTGLDISDAVSGFRAISRDAARQINIVSDFSYTIEMLIQASAKRLAVMSVPIGTNAKTRESRLFKSIPQFLRMSGTTLVRMYTMYKPLKVFFALGLVMLVAGVLPIGRFLYFYAIGDGAGHVQSIVLGGMLVVLGVVTLLIGLLADLINFNRKLMEMTLMRIGDMESQLGNLHSSTPRKIKLKRHRSLPREQIEAEMAELSTRRLTQSGS